MNDPISIATEQTTQMQPLLLAAGDVAQLIRVSKATFYRLVAAGEFPAGKAISANCVRWKMETVVAWVDARMN